MIAVVLLVGWLLFAGSLIRPLRTYLFRSSRSLPAWFWSVVLACLWPLFIAGYSRKALLTRMVGGSNG